MRGVPGGSACASRGEVPPASDPAAGPVAREVVATPPPGGVVVGARALRSEAGGETRECVAQEVAVAFELDGASQVVMLATPTDLDDFALGFCLTEGWIARPEELLVCEIRLRERGIVLALTLAPAAGASRDAPRRNLVGRTGCGLCGTDDLAGVVRLPAEGLPSTRVDSGAFARAMAELAHRQPLGRATGATHAAALCDLDGRVRLVREDVGRHNALDKLIGAMLRAGLDPTASFVAVTSRASVEMVQKTALAGVSILAAVSAPTQLAIQVARDAGLLLAGFVREGRATIYAGAARVTDRGGETD
ncbi:MAG: formate dehydrogenase accessory sulfurtransferase FdhD [Myxococcota bacterium]